ncbi:tetratricopeptide-like helical protein [Lasius niger]|uniref:Tetratricopeptide-like helical protein n=1 Tax=Lasius niger TaxID=67767 RepID=A0A0J7K6Q3_LASNI|nr:tetratricopeptide-like helical protein [Lasius niger]
MEWNACLGAGWSEYGRRSSWWAIITYKVIKDIGRQRAEVEDDTGEDDEDPDQGEGRQGRQGRQENGQVRECDIYIVIKSREQVRPLGEIPVLEQLQTH